MSNALLFRVCWSLLLSLTLFTYNNNLWKWVCSCCNGSSFHCLHAWKLVCGQCWEFSKWGNLAVGLQEKWGTILHPLPAWGHELKKKEWRISVCTVKHYAQADAHNRTFSAVRFFSAQYKLWCKTAGRNDERSAGWSSESSSHLTLKIPLSLYGGIVP